MEKDVRVVGRNAGKIYRALAVHGRLTTSSLQRATLITEPSDLQDALSWMKHQLLIISETKPATRRGLFTSRMPRETYYRLARNASSCFPEPSAASQL